MTRNSSAGTETLFYDRPIWYDIIHDKGTAWEVGFLRRIAERWARTRERRGRSATPPPPEMQTWLEPACGTARYLRYLARRGYNVVGYDVNENMLHYARRRIARIASEDRAEILLGDMTSFCRPNAFDFSFNMINTFRHLMSETDARTHLELTAESLKDGAAYLLGVDVIDYSIPEPMEETWTATRAGCEVTHTMIAIPPERNTRREKIVNHITVRTRNREFYYESTYDLYAYDLDQFLNLIESSPFEIVDAYDFLHQPVQITRKSRDMNLVLKIKE